jgi:excisionase family DNA binding protein
MTCYGLVQAAEMAGVSRATFWRLIKRGAVSATRAEGGSYQIEASELDRYLMSTAIERARRETVNKPEMAGEPAHEQAHSAVHTSSPEAEIAQLKWLLELERERVAHEREMVQVERQRVEDERRRAEELRQDRDRWHAQAERLALPSPNPFPAHQTAPQPNTTHPVPIKRRGWWPFRKRA